MTDTNKVLYDAHVAPNFRTPKLSVTSPVLQTIGGQPCFRANPCFSPFHENPATSAAAVAAGDYGYNLLYLNGAPYDANVALPPQAFSPCVAALWYDLSAPRTHTLPSAASLVALYQQKYGSIIEGHCGWVDFNSNNANTITFVAGAGITTRGGGRAMTSGKILFVFTNVRPTTEAVTMYIMGN